MSCVFSPAPPSLCLGTSWPRKPGSLCPCHAAELCHQSLSRAEPRAGPGPSQVNWENQPTKQSKETALRRKFYSPFSMKTIREAERLFTFLIHMSIPRIKNVKLANVHFKDKETYRKPLAGLG